MSCPCRSVGQLESKDWAVFGMLCGDRLQSCVGGLLLETAPLLSINHLPPLPGSMILPRALNSFQNKSSTVFEGGLRGIPRGFSSPQDQRGAGCIPQGSSSPLPPSSLHTHLSCGLGT